MKKLTFLFLLVFAIAMTQAQSYQISFAGTGASTNVDSVEVENLTQCTDTIISGSNTIMTGFISEMNTDADNAMFIYPNPMTYNCSMSFIATAQGKTTIALYDITGKRILQILEILSIGRHTYTLSGIISGIYFLKIESEKYSYNKKLVSINSTFDVAEIKLIKTVNIVNKQSIVSNTGNSKHSKSAKSAIHLPYMTGDTLKITGISGIYRTVYMLVLNQNQTVTFNFVDCTDADGNHYSVVQIDTMIWMAENLKTTRYRNGNNIPNVTNDTAWRNLTTGAYCNFDNTTYSDTINTYGRLYNWYAVVDTSNIAPQGWHVPSDSEWFALETFLGGSSIAGGKIKDKCKYLWTSPNVGATNETGFTALPGGYRDFSGMFYDLGGGTGLAGFWWSSTMYNTNAWYRFMLVMYSTLDRTYGYKTRGLSIRCVKD